MANKAPTTEEAALRRVATLVARESSPVEIFVAVTREAAQVLECDAAGLLRFEPDGKTATLVAQSDTPWDPPPLGTAFPLDGENVVTQVFHTGRAARDDVWTDASGAVAGMASALGVRSAVASPVSVQGRLWGTIIAATAQDEPLPAEMEARIAQFTELIAIAISNAEARASLARLVEEQAALRRVAVLVAEQPSQEEVFAAVAEVVGSLLGADVTAMAVFPDNVAARVVASWSREEPSLPVGTLLPLDSDSAVVRIYHSAKAARMDDYTGGANAEIAQSLGVRAAVGAPIFVGGELWGALAVAVRGDDPLPEGAEARLAAFTELVATAVSNAQANTDVQRLLDEQAALRRVAVLVAQQPSPEEIFVAVAEAVASLLGADMASMSVFSDDVAATVVASWSREGPVVPVGTLLPLDNDGATARVFHSGAAARVDSYPPDAVPEVARTHGVRSAIGAPVSVGGKLWGVVGVAVRGDDPLPEGAEARLAAFTELVATAVSNAQASGDLQRLLEEQAALRRVATLVATGARPEDVFAGVAEEVGRLLPITSSTMARYEPDATLVTLASWAGVGDPSPVGKSWPLEGTNVGWRVFQTGQPARIDDYSEATDPIGVAAREAGMKSAVGSPIVVEGQLWGVVTARSTEAPLPSETGDRLSSFTELVATAIANAEARDARALLAEEQAALRRVATLVADGIGPEGVFPAVAAEVDVLFGADVSAIVRFEEGREATVLGDVGGPHMSGKRVTLDAGYVVDQVRETRHSARFDTDDPSAEGMPSIVRALGIRSAVASPIVVEGEVWGAITAASVDEPLATGAERRLSEFTELVATSVSNTQARERVTTLAEEQAALRRVATLVAEEAPQVEIFNAVAEGVAGVLGEELRLVRFEGEAAVVVAGSEGPHSHVLPLGTRLPVGGNNALSHVFRTGKPTRIDEYASATGPIAEAVQAQGLRSIVATPVVVEGRTWGAMIVGTFREQPVPAGTEGRLGQFAELMATGIANTEARNEIERLAEQETALRRLATLVAEGAEPEQVFAAVTDLTAATFGAITAVMRFEHDPPVNVVVGVSKVTGIPIGTRWPLADGMTSTEVYRTGRSARLGAANWPSLPGAVGDAGLRFGITSQVACPIVVEGSLWGVITLNAAEELPPDTERRLEKFTELVTTAIANTEARAELLASRARIVAAGDEARRRIERNLHDGTQQRLLALGLDLQRARLAIPEDQLETRLALESAEHDIEVILGDLRELSHGLHPPLLSRLGLGPSLQALARRSPIPVHLEIELPDRPEPALETAMYYVVSEALTNAIKHSQASEITVTISGGERLQAAIVDDGVGGADPGRGSGLTGLFDRVDALGGSFAYDSPAQGGTRISVELPVSS
jgi:GAF domain-containing protein